MAGEKVSETVLGPCQPRQPTLSTGRAQGNSHVDLLLSTFNQFHLSLYG